MQDNKKKNLSDKEKEKQFKIEIETFGKVCSNCEHFRDIIEREKAIDSVLDSKYICEAFPEGIPLNEIWKNKHKEPIPEQNNEIVFKPIQSITEQELINSRTSHYNKKFKTFTDVFKTLETKISNKNLTIHQLQTLKGELLNIKSIYLKSKNPDGTYPTDHQIHNNRASLIDEFAVIKRGHKTVYNPGGKAKVVETIDNHIEFLDNWIRTVDHKIDIIKRNNQTIVDEIIDSDVDENPPVKIFATHFTVALMFYYIWKADKKTDITLTEENADSIISKFYNPKTKKKQTSGKRLWKDSIEIQEDLARLRVGSIKYMKERRKKEIKGACDLIQLLYKHDCVKAIELAKEEIQKIDNPIQKLFFSCW